MLRLPAVAGRFYPSDPVALKKQVQQFTRDLSQNKAEGNPEKTKTDVQASSVRVKACLVPHAGYVYSGSVAGAVFSRIALPRKILLLGVRHHPKGERAAILSSGAWRTPLGDVQIDTNLADALRIACPSLREDNVAHNAEHSLEVQLPFLQVLVPDSTFVPIALGAVHLEELIRIGEGIGRTLAAAREHEEVLLLTTSDLNHYEDDATTRKKDQKAIDQLLTLNAHGLYNTCRNEGISMCGLGSAVAMLTALKILGAERAELIRYATSADVSGDRKTVVGYAGMIFF